MGKDEIVRFVGLVAGSAGIDHELQVPLRGGPGNEGLGAAKGIVMPKIGAALLEFTAVPPCGAAAFPLCAAECPTRTIHAASAAQMLRAPPYLGTARMTDLPRATSCRL